MLGLRKTRLHGWELLQLIVEEQPAVLATPAMLANVLRYLLYGRAPHKERVCLLLHRVLPALDLGTLPIDVPALHALEQQVARRRLLPACPFYYE